MNARETSAPMGRAEWGMLLALTVLWSATFPFAKIALAELPPLTLVLVRIVIAALALQLAVLAAGQRMPRERRLWGALFVMGALNNLIPFSVMNWGLTHIASGLGSILNATTPLFTIVVAHFSTRDEKMTGNKIVGVLSGLIGVVVMIGLDAVKGFGYGVLGEIACLVGASSFAFAGIYGRRFKRMGLTPLVAATGQVTATAVMMLPLAAVVDRPWTMPAMPGPTTWGAVLTIALLSTALAYILYFRILATAGATNLMLVTFLMPIGSILLGATLLGERLAPRHFTGMALIGLGLIAIDGRPLAAIRQVWRRAWAAS